MKAYAVVENCQEGLEAETGYASILGIFLMSSDPHKALEARRKAEECLKKRYAEAKAMPTYETGNDPEYADERDSICLMTADWIDSSNDTAHFLDIRETEVTEC